MSEPVSDRDALKRAQFDAFQALNTALSSGTSDDIAEAADTYDRTTRRLWHYDRAGFYSAVLESYRRRPND